VSKSDTCRFPSVGRWFGVVAVLVVGVGARATVRAISHAVRASRAEERERATRPDIDPLLMKQLAATADASTETFDQLGGTMGVYASWFSASDEAARALWKRERQQVHNPFTGKERSIERLVLDTDGLERLQPLKHPSLHPLFVAAYFDIASSEHVTQVETDTVYLIPSRLVVQAHARPPTVDQWRSRASATLMKRYAHTFDLGCLDLELATDIARLVGIAADHSTSIWGFDRDDAAPPAAKRIQIVRPKYAKWRELVAGAEQRPMADLINAPDDLLTFVAGSRASKKDDCSPRELPLRLSRQLSMEVGHGGFEYFFNITSLMPSGH
jgi:hypothetical protein